MATEQERRRLEAHFANVIQVLEARDVSAWPTAKQEARKHSIAMVRTYASRGRFPVNRQRHGWSPVFQDATGTVCAMGYVAEGWGRRDLVDWVRANDNTVRLAERVPAPLAVWLPTTGLTQQEAAMVQPSYGCDHPYWSPCEGPIVTQPPPTQAVPVAPSGPGWETLAVATALVLVPLMPAVYLALRNAWDGATVWGLRGTFASGLMVVGSAVLGASVAVGGTLAGA